MIRRIWNVMLPVPKEASGGLSVTFQKKGQSVAYAGHVGSREFSEFTAHQTMVKGEEFETHQ